LFILLIIIVIVSGLLEWKRIGIDVQDPVLSRG
jgi:hypothetical protein